MADRILPSDLWSYYVLNLNTYALTNIFMIFLDFIYKSYSQLSIAFLIADFLPNPS